MASIWRFAVRKWAWVWGLSAAAGTLSALTLALTAPQFDDTTIYYTQGGLLSLLLLVFLCAVPGVMVGLVLLIFRTGKVIPFGVLAVASVCGGIFWMALSGPAVSLSLEREHVDSACMDGHVYNLARTTSFSYQPSAWMLYECDRLGIRCTEIYRDEDSTLFYSDKSSAQLVVEDNSLQVLYRDRVLYVHQP